jgi:hypothetical protein
MATVGSSKPVDRRKKRKFIVQPRRKKTESEFDLAVRQLAQSDHLIQDAEASVMRFSEELYMLQQSFGEKEQIVVEARRLLEVAQARLGMAIMNKQKAETIVSQKKKKKKG